MYQRLLDTDVIYQVKRYDDAHTEPSSEQFFESALDAFECGFGELSKLNAQCNDLCFNRLSDSGFEVYPKNGYGTVVVTQHTVE
jgi:hypothetical protein